MRWFLNWYICKILVMKELRRLIRLLRNLVIFKEKRFMRNVHAILLYSVGLPVSSLRRTSASTLE